MAWCAWLNSTPGLLMLLQQRTKDLTYPAFPLANLRALPVPKPDRTEIKRLRRAFEEVRSEKLLPLPSIARCDTRRVLDSAAARVLGISGETVGRWRTLVGNEPSITERAPAPS